ncbi:MAG: FUSC family protein, partial [Lachnospiraceae bacterium]|nr:FUSC family protein [Lachnospiraceae bacterium]
MNIKNTAENTDRGIKLPAPGQRILRSVLAALLCVAIYFLRGRSGALFYSIIAALQCIQPYTANMLKVGKNRITGTLIGAFWGAVVLFGALWITGGQVDYDTTLIYYIILALFIGIVL